MLDASKLIVHVHKLIDVDVERDGEGIKRAHVCSIKFPVIIFRRSPVCLKSGNDVENGHRSEVNTSLIQD